MLDNCLHPAVVMQQAGQPALPVLAELPGTRRHVCDQRWHDITRGIFMRGTAVALPGQPPIKQPTWCRLQPDKFGAVAARVRSPHPENVLLIYRPAGSGFEQELSSGAQGQGLRLAVAEAARQELLPGQPGRT